MNAIGHLLGVEMVQYEQKGDVCLFLLDLAPLGYRGMHTNVVMVTPVWNDSDHGNAYAKVLDDYQDTLRTAGFCFHLVIGQYGTGCSLPTTTHLELVTLQPSHIRHLCLSNTPRITFLMYVRDEFNLNELCPFNTDTEARGMMFVGRETELTALTTRMNKSYAVSGSRRVGKTSLLRKAYDQLRFQGKNRQRVHFVTCQTISDPLIACQSIAREACRTSVDNVVSVSSLATIITNETRHGASPIRLFLDEIDKLVDYDREHGWQFFDMLSSLVAPGGHDPCLRLVVAGYRAIDDLLGLTERSAPKQGSLLAGKITEIQLQPLSRDQTRELLVEPFRRLDFVVKNADAIVDASYDATRGYPYMIHKVGELIYARAVERNPPTLDLSDCQSAFTDQSIRKFLFKHLTDNTRGNDASRVLERRITYMMCHQQFSNREWSDQDVMVRSEELGFPIIVEDPRSNREDAVRQALEALERANVIASTIKGYHIAIPMMGAVVRSAYPDLKLAMKYA
jgi:hypothetical protein